MDQNGTGHAAQCPHCGNALQVSLAFQVAKPGAYNPAFSLVESTGEIVSAELRTKREPSQMADTAESLRDQAATLQRWREY